MIKKTYFFRGFLLFFLLTHLSDCFSQNKEVIFESKVTDNDTVIGINELVKIEFKANVNFDAISSLTFKDFKIVSGPTTAIYNNQVAGESSRNENDSTFLKSYYYVLKPTKIGRLNIRSETIQFNNEEFHTPSVRIRVTDTVQKISYVTKGMAIGQEKIHLFAKIEEHLEIKDSISISYKLYFPPSIGLQRFGFLDIPEYRGFNFVDKPLGSYSPTVEFYKDHQYRIITLKQFDFYLKDFKKLKIEPLSIELFFEAPTDEYDDSGNRIYESLYLHIESEQY